jgi:hypothetical protein
VINTDPVVYLAGPITGLSYAGCTEWRQGAIEELAKAGIKGVSPMRGKEYLENLATISGHGREYAHMSPLSTPKGVVIRDHWDVIRSKVLFVNLLQKHLPPEKRIVSIGTCCEIAWKWHVKGPIVLVMEKTTALPENDPNYFRNGHDHMFVTEMCTYHVETVKEGLDLVKAIMNNAI